MIILIVLLSLTLLSLLVMVIDEFIIPLFNQDSIVRKWWKKHIIDEDPFDHL